MNENFSYGSLPTLKRRIVLRLAVRVAARSAIQSFQNLSSTLLSMG
ncbi:MAG: hypothetical protein V7L21_16215 [Nostoc sp.]|nr:hypothetical protein [Nostoc sp. NMS9]